MASRTRKSLALLAAVAALAGVFALYPRPEMLRTMADRIRARFEDFLAVSVSPCYAFSY